MSIRHVYHISATFFYSSLLYSRHLSSFSKKKKTEQRKKRLPFFPSAAKLGSDRVIDFFSYRDSNDFKIALSFVFIFFLLSSKSGTNILFLISKYYQQGKENEGILIYFHIM
jgi:hypothetical protein